MKKYIIAACLLLAVALGGAVWVHQSVQTGGHDANVTETIYTGDKHTTEGIAITTELVDFDADLGWTCKTTLGEELVTETTLFRHPEIPNIEETEAFLASELGWQSSIDLESGIEDVYGEEIFSSNVPVQMFVDAADKTKAGTTHRQIVNLKDYTDYFPVWLSLFEGDGKWALIFSDTEKNHLYQNLQIPVPDSYPIEVEITKDENGIVTDLKYEASNPLYLYSSGFIHEDSVYVAANSGRLEKTDTICPMKEPYRGLLQIPIENGENVIASKTKLLFPLEDDVLIKDLQLSADGKDFLLLTVEEDQYHLSVIDRQTCKLKQKLSLMPYSSSFFTAMDTETYYLAMQIDGTYVLAEKADDGYSLFCSENFHAVESNGKYLEICLEKNALATAFNGEKLAIAIMKDVGSNLPTPTLYLQICDKNGLLYAGRYDNSLEQKISDQEIWAMGVDVDFVH